MPTDMELLAAYATLCRLEEALISNIYRCPIPDCGGRFWHEGGGWAGPCVHGDEPLTRARLRGQAEERERLRELLHGEGN